MRKFEGNINGKKYTDEKEFNKALLDWDGKEDMSVSYQYISVPDENEKDETKLLDTNVCNNECNNYVSESDYIKNISNKSDIELDSNLINNISLTLIGYDRPSSCLFNHIGHYHFPSVCNA